MKKFLKIEPDGYYNYWSSSSSERQSRYSTCNVLVIDTLSPSPLQQLAGIPPITLYEKEVIYNTNNVKCFKRIR